jgi:hypothetical protein
MGDTLTFVIRPQFDGESSFSEGLAAVKREKLWGYIDKKGAVRVPHSYAEAKPFSDGLAAVCKDGRWGFIDQKGRTVIACEYGQAESFSDGYARVRRGKNWLAVDKRGAALAIDPAFSVHKASEGLFVAAREDKPGLSVFGPKGALVFDCEYDILLKYSEGLAAFKSGDKWGYLDAKGRIAVPAVYKSANEFSEGLANVGLESGKTTFIDKKGKPISEDGWSLCAYEFRDGLCYFTDYGKSHYDEEKGFLNTKGKVEFKFSQHGYADVWFSEGFAAVEYSSDWCGFIDKKGKSVGQKSRVAMTRNFSEGLAAVYDRGSWGYVGKP